MIYILFFHIHEYNININIPDQVISQKTLVSSKIPNSIF